MILGAVVWVLVGLGRIWVRPVAGLPPLKVGGGRGSRIRFWLAHGDVFVEGKFFI